MIRDAALFTGSLSRLLGLALLVAFALATASCVSDESPEPAVERPASDSVPADDDDSLSVVAPEDRQLECDLADRAFWSATPDAADRGSRSPLEAARLRFASELVDDGDVVPISAARFALVAADGTTVAIGDVIQLPTGRYSMTEVESCV